jgi:TetR/AcrR family transcriptional regulator, transcriptional repressor for nem operon
LTDRSLMPRVEGMGRPRGFDEQAVIAAAAALFAGRVYAGVSVDDLVTELGVHRNSLYKTFGSKRGLYLAALRWYVEHDLSPLVDRLAAGADLSVAVAGDGLDLLLLAAIERAPADVEVAAVVAEAWHRLEQALSPTGGLRQGALNTLLGERLRARAATPQPPPTRAS